MKVIKHTGLVAVTALTRFKNHASGSTFGVDPLIALEALSKEQVSLADVPEDVETYDYVVSGASATEVKEAAVIPAVEIPEDWETLHPVKICAIAKTIIGGDLPKENDKKPTDVAREIILAEIERRSGAADDAADSGDGSEENGADGSENGDQSGADGNGGEQGGQENQPAE